MSNNKPTFRDNIGEIDYYLEIRVDYEYRPRSLRIQDTLTAIRQVLHEISKVKNET